MTDSIYQTTGNYKELLTYQKATVIYDVTYYFCHKFLDKKDRTVDQMIQAARSGKQNIVEGSAASVTSSETEIKLINVAKASMQELLVDYEDYLRTRKHFQWEKGSKEYEYMRKLGRENHNSEFFMPIVETRPPQTIANMMIILINQNDYLLFRQLQSLEKNFLQNGGIRERMTRLRVAEREKLKDFNDIKVFKR